MRQQYRNQEVDPLLRLSSELLRTEDLASLASSLPAMLETAFSARLVVVHLSGIGRFVAPARGVPQIEEDEAGVQRSVDSQETNVVKTADCLLVPLQVGGTSKGYFLVHDGVSTLKAARRAGELVSMALDRAHSLGQGRMTCREQEIERLRRSMVELLTQELRSPLTAIKGAASCLLWMDVSSEARRELLTVINEESDRIDRFISSAVSADLPYRAMLG